MEIKESVEHAIGHMCETNEIRRLLWHMDEKVEDLLYGIRQGDDAVVVGDVVVNMEGPYPLKIGRKTGLIHTCSDIVVMGGRPLFALNSMQVNDIKDAAEVIEDIKKQSMGLGVPVVGGNTQTENDLVPCVSFAVYGRLVGRPIPDCGAKVGDRILLFGDVVEGSIGERVYRAKTKFEAFLDLIGRGVRVNASKDASRGGWFGNLMEIMVKSRRGIRVTSIPYSRITRYMGNYLLSIPKNEVESVIKVAASHKCPVVEVGVVSSKLEVKLGGDVVVDGEKMRELIRNVPYRRARSI